MKVKELLETLQNVDPEIEVYVWCENLWPIKFAQVEEIDEWDGEKEDGYLFYIE